jgi:tRNA modification GTPase
VRKDTIYALSTAPGRAGLAVLRVSGEQAGAALSRLTRGPLPAPRMAVLRRIFDAAGDALDEGLVLWFRGPASFTGEDVAEFHVHGGRAVVGGLLGALGHLPGLRLAEPGEFTRRAVGNGKFELTAAEGLADLIAAETEGQRRQALRQYDGALAALYEGWRTRLIGQAAWIEASHDFPEEELPKDLLAHARAALQGIAEEIARHLDDGGRGEIVRDGLRLALIGPPNAGKSSLMNALARRDVAIVSETPGTTRDVIEIRLDLGGYAVTLADTAGLRDVDDAVEAAIEIEGMRRALARARAADLVVLVLDASSDARPVLSDDVADRLCLTVWNKCDLVRRETEPGVLNLSVRTGEGMDAFVAALSVLIEALSEAGDDAAPLTRARHREALGEAFDALVRACAAPDAFPELMAEDVRLALRALGRITGRVDVEELLDVVFREFCIGK